MPSKSQRQHDMMKMAAAGKSDKGPSKEVAKEFLRADKKAGKFKGKGRRKGKSSKGRGRSEKGKAKSSRRPSFNDVSGY